MAQCCKDVSLTLHWTGAAELLNEGPGLPQDSHSRDLKHCLGLAYGKQKYPTAFIQHTSTARTQNYNFLPQNASAFGGFLAVCVHIHFLIICALESLSLSAQT